MFDSESVVLDDQLANYAIHQLSAYFSDARLSFVQPANKKHSESRY